MDHQQQQPRRVRTELCPRCGNFKENVDDEFCSKDCEAEARRAARRGGD